LTSPIQNQIGSVFVPVSDMQRAITWYSELFRLQAAETSHEGTTYDVPMAGETGLILDANRDPVTNSSQPLCFFWTENLETAHAFLQQRGVEITSDVTDIGSASFLAFRDPDGNPLMVCQRNT